MELMAEEKKGFKRTEVGAIPEDWDVLNIGDILKLKSGYAFSSEYYSDYGPILLTPGNFKLTGGLYFNDRNTKRFSGEYSRNQVFSKGDLLVVMTDLTPDCNLLGKPALVDVDEPVLHNQRIGKIELFKPNISEDFLYYYFLSSTYLDHIKNTSTGSTVSHTSNGSIYASKIPLPPTLEEQQAIATALSDVDELIRSLDRLIQKKQAIKKGTMQQLLSGKKRLPGFDGEWEEYELGDLGNFKNGINKSKDAFGHGSPFVNLMDVFGIRSINQTKHLKLVDSNSAEKATYDLRKGDVLFVRSSVKPSGVGLTTLVEKDLPNTVYSGFLIRFRDDGVLNNEYKAYCFHETSFRNRLIAKSSVSANTNINQESLKVLKIKIPPSQAEQKAIAQILSDMDRELQTLNHKREKYVQIKQGMMQELLTGRVRLM